MKMFVHLWDISVTMSKCFGCFLVLFKGNHFWHSLMLNWNISKSPTKAISRLRTYLRNALIISFDLKVLGIRFKYLICKQFFMCLKREWYTYGLNADMFLCSAYFNKCHEMTTGKIYYKGLSLRWLMRTTLINCMLNYWLITWMIGCFGCFWLFLLFGLFWLLLVVFDWLKLVQRNNVRLWNSTDKRS